MKRRSINACILALLVMFISGNLAFSFAQQTDKPIAIVGALIVDGTGAQPFNGTVIIQGERILAVGANLAIPAKARIIRANGQTLIPGIFDLHTHLEYATVRGINSDWPKNLKAYLYSGVTTVVDFGTYPETFAPMRRLIKSGVVAAPRIHFAARFSTPGGHGAEGGRGDLFTLEVQTPREAKAAVERILPYQPDVIKVFTDGWRYGTATDMTSMNEETLAAIVETAHRYGIEVLTHTVTLEKAKIAARAGVDVLAHGIGNAKADDELIRLMKANGTNYVSTLAVYEPLERPEFTPLLENVLSTEAKESLKAPAPVAPTAPTPTGETPTARRWKFLLSNISTLKNAGINLGTGTDAGIVGTHHGWATLREIKLLVEGGLSPLEALTAATGNSARALHVDHERGFIKAGWLADLVLLDGAPLQNINDIERINKVFLNGKELDRQKLASDIAMPGITPLATSKAQEQLDDFERLDGRSEIDTLWINAYDSGHDHTKMVWGKTLRSPHNHALSVMSLMSQSAKPFARVSLPLRRGGVEPVDASLFRGVQFEVRGDGEYALILATYGTSSGGNFQSKFSAGAIWKTVQIDFASIKNTQPKWTGADLLMLTFEVSRKPGELGWLELDNVKFYR
ncbi:MAG: CIA30 family protein [Acidobacteria bacterium]|nr:CIA30 family protein [Acidobacteriota bacterium]